MEAPNNHGGSDLTAASSDERRFFEKMKEEMKLVVIGTIGEVITPIMENTTRKIVKEQIQIALQKLFPNKDWNNELEITTSAEGRSLQLKFLGTVSAPVLTGGELNGKDGAAIKLAIFDTMTKQLVASGPEASAKVEILILQANHNEDELNWSIEDFNKRIIRGRNEGMPYFSKEMYVYLKSGEGILCNVKLGHGSKWVKDCLCRLGARVVDNFSGSTVRVAWTESFMVRDCRIEYNKKNETPSLSDRVSRLSNIARGGNIDQRLQHEKIYTVEDFLTRLLKDYNGLKNIVHLGGKKWEDIVKNARACPSGNRMYCYMDSMQDTGVVFNIHGEIRGLYSERQYAVQVLSEKNKVVATELFSSAIDHWDDIIRFDDENSLQLYLTSLRTSVDQLDSLEPGYFVGPHNTETSEPFDEHVDTSSPSTIPNMASTQEIDFDPPFSIDDVPIMCDRDFEPFPFSNLNQEEIFSGVTLENLLNEINVEAVLEEMNFMLAVPNSKAQHRWTKLFSVSRFFSVRKMVASEGYRTQKRPRVC